MTNSDLLYKHEFEDYITNFCSMVNRETNIQTLAETMVMFKQSQILSVLMSDPTNEQAKMCVRQTIQQRVYLPQDFLSKFLAIITMKINLMPSNLGFVHQSYNAKIIATNLLPTTKITNLTEMSIRDELQNDAQKATVFVRKGRLPPQTLRLPFTDELLPKCINAIGDLNQVIVEGNRYNGREMNDFIKTTYK